jgi:hypothetical protein
MLLFCGVSTTALLKRCHGHVEYEEATFVLTVPQHSFRILECFILKFVVKGLHLVNYRTLKFLVW